MRGIFLPPYNLLFPIVEIFIVNLQKSKNGFVFFFVSDDADAIAIRNCTPARACIRATGRECIELEMGLMILETTCIVSIADQFLGISTVLRYIYWRGSDILKSRWMDE